MEPETPSVIEIPKEQVRKISSERVEVLDGAMNEATGEHMGSHMNAEGHRPASDPFFAFQRNIKVIRGGPLMYFAPLLLPLFLIAVIVMFIPVMILMALFGRRVMTQSAVFKRFRP